MTHQQDTGPDRHRGRRLGVDNNDDASAVSALRTDAASEVEIVLDTALRDLRPDPVWLNRLGESLTEAVREGASAVEIEADLREIIDQSFPGQARHSDITELAERLTHTSSGPVVS